MLAAVVPRIGALLAHRGVQAVAAGLLSGAVVGAAGVASGVIPLGGSKVTTTVALLACPGSGLQVARISSGQTLLVTARSADGSWLQVYDGEPGIDRAWAPTSALRLQAAPDGLPVADCGAPVSYPAPTVTPAPSRQATAAVSASPGSGPGPTPKASATPKPTHRPTPAPTPVSSHGPTPPPDLTDPTLSNLHVSATCIGPDVTSSTVSVTATDPDDPIGYVAMAYQYPGSEYFLMINMNHAGGSVWQVTFTYSSSMVTLGYITYSATAFDSHGNASTSLGDDPSSADNFIQVAPGGCGSG